MSVRLPVLFVSDLVLLPGMVVPVELDDASRAAIDAARTSSDATLLVVPRSEEPGSDHRYAAYGAIASVERVGRFSGGAAAAVLRAERRGRIGSGVTGPGAALWVEVEPVEEHVTDRARELAEEYKRLVVAVLQRREAWQVVDTVNRLTDPSAIADTAGWAPYLSDERKRELLETPDVEKRLETVVAWTRDHLAEVDVADKIGADVREGMERSQREFLLRQQLAAIRKELGEGEPEGADDYRARVEAADVPEAVREALLREVGKLERASEQNPEAAWVDALAAAGVDPLFFYDIDTPVTVAALRSGGAEYLRTDQVPLFTRYLSFTGGPFLREVLEGELGAREARPLYCSVDAARYRPVAAEPDLACDLGYMGTYAPDRQPVLERFLLEVARRMEDRAFQVAGPQYPDDVRWPPNVRHREHLPPSRHAAFYSSCDWQLNATRADMVRAGWSPSVRLFEAAACGAAMISDRWAGLDAFFAPGREILLPGSTEEVVEILRGTHPDDRRALGAAARERILAEHTAAHRAAELESLLRLETAAG